MERRIATGDPRGDVVGAIEAAYAIDLPDPAWLAGLLAALRPSFEDGLGMAGYLYDTFERPFRVYDLMHDTPVDDAGVAQMLDPSNDDYVRTSWLWRGALTASEVPGFADVPVVRDVLSTVGIRDFMTLNVFDPVGVGCWIGAPLRALRRLTEAERERWNRVAAHVRAALRLRLRLAGRGEPIAGSDGAIEAAFGIDGRIEHLEPGAQHARASLRRAVLGMETARDALRDDPDRALPAWGALVNGRWTLVDDFHAGGKRYVVARANEFGSSGSRLLTPRERQVTQALAMGLTNKEVAYELGMSHSTVRVLVARARVKLGAATSAELVTKIRDELLGRPSDRQA